MVAHSGSAASSAAAAQSSESEAGGSGLSCGSPAGIVHPSEVHLLEGGRADVLEAEGRLRVRQGVGGLDGFLLEIHHQMAGVKQRLAVVLVVQNSAALVRGGGMRHPQRQPVAALAFVASHGLAAARAGDLVVALSRFWQKAQLGYSRRVSTGATQVSTRALRTCRPLA